MTQKIEGNLPASAPVRTSTPGGKVSSTGADPSSPVSAAAASDSLSLTGEATGLQNLQRELQSAPAVDSNRVEAVRDSLASGSYKVDSDAIANRMMDLDQQLAW